MWETLYHYFFIFFVFAFLGWCVEVAYAAVRHHRFVNRGFLGGPVCPIYGLGVLAVYLILSPLRHTWLLLFLASMLLTSVLELSVGFLLDRLFHNKWWDYSQQRCNLFGYICLRFSLIWGVLCTLVVRLLFPPLERLMALIPLRVGLMVEGGLLVLLVADTVVAVSVAIGLDRQLRALDVMAGSFRLGSDRLGERIFTGTEKVYEEYLHLLDRGRGLRRRLVEAFPSMRSRRHDEQLRALRERWETLREQSRARRRERRERRKHSQK